MVRYLIVLATALASSQAPGLKFSSVVADNAHTCAVTVDGDAYCWGDNNFGQLGDGTKKDQLTPVPVTGGLKFKQIVLNSESLSGQYGAFTCGLTKDGRAYCWGKNRFAQLGDGTTRDRQVPTPVVGGLTFTELATGSASVCGLTVAATVHCWGAVGGLTVAGTSVLLIEKPIEVSPFGSTKPARFIDDALGDPCVLGEDGTAYCWDAPPGSKALAIAAVTPPGQAFQSVALGGLTRTCGIKTDGALFCWSEAGQSITLSRGAMTGRTPPPAGFGRFQILEFGTRFTFVRRSLDLCAVTVDGQLMCLSNTEENKLPLGSDAIPKLTAEVPNLKLAALHLQSYHRCGVTAGGELYCWKPGSDPARVGADLTFATVSWASDAACGLTVGGDVYCWGNNRDGQVGDGTKTARPTPVPIKLR